MLVYDLSGVNTLPAVSNWLSPKYRGVEDELFQEEDVNLPRNWKKDFSDYVYKYEELTKYKKELNESKRRIDPISRSNDRRRKFDTITDLVRAMDELRGYDGLLSRRYGAEVVTNAWLKMFELMVFLEPMLSKLNKSKKNRGFKSLHIAEAPGNFMLAINHKLHTEYPSIEWEWLANSYRQLYYARGSNRDQEYNTHYLPDQYGLINQYPDRWIFGADGDGDITSPANLISFSQEVKEKFGGALHFMTSDVKYVPLDVNFDEEERINIPVHLGHLICALMCLSKGGTMILKEFTLFEASSVSMLYIMSYCFKQLKIVKPETSRPANSEIYVVGIDYKKNLTPIQMDKLMNVMNYIRFLNTEAGSPALFTMSDIPRRFVEKLSEIEKKLVDSQLSKLDRNLDLFIKYEDEPLDKIKKDLSHFREEAAAKWVKKTGIKPMDPGHKIARSRSRKDRRQFV